MSQDSKQPSARPADPSAAQPHGVVPTAAGPSHLDISLDDLGALLGGARAKSVIAGAPQAAAFVATLDAPRAWLSPGITADQPSVGIARQFALEIASLKLRCFDALVRMLIGNHHVGGLPVSRVVGRMHDKPGAIHPARWAFEIVLGEHTGKTSATMLGVDLGNVLVRLLLANDQRTPAQAEQMATKALQTFTGAAKKLKDASRQHLEEAALTSLRNSGLGDSSSVLYDADMRARLAGGAVPQSLWFAAIKLILRLQSKIEGFSFGETPLLDLCAELATLAQHLDVATFGAMARRTEIEAVVRHQLEKLN